MARRDRQTRQGEQTSPVAVTEALADRMEREGESARQQEEIAGDGKQREAIEDFAKAVEEMKEREANEDYAEGLRQDGAQVDPVEEDLPEEQSLTQQATPPGDGLEQDEAFLHEERDPVPEERGPDFSQLTVPELASVVAKVVEEHLPDVLPGERVSQAEMREALRFQGDAIPRMSQQQLESRIRIAPKWRSLHPKRPGTTAYALWYNYVDGMTVSAFLASAGDRRRLRSDLRWNLAHGFIYLQTPREWEEEQQQAGIEGAVAEFHTHPDEVSVSPGQDDLDSTDDQAA